MIYEQNLGNLIPFKFAYSMHMQSSAVLFYMAGFFSLGLLNELL